MTQPVSLIVFAGSARRASFNRRLAAAAAREAEALGGEVELLELADFPLPIYNGDLEENDGPPPALGELKRRFAAADGFLVVSPEYNSSVTPLLKNTLDWLSRSHGDEPSMVAFRGKVAGMLAASPGRLGGLRGLSHLRPILVNLGVHVVPEQFALGAAHKALSDRGEWLDDGQKDGVVRVAKSVVHTASRLRD